MYCTFHLTLFGLKVHRAVFSQVFPRSLACLAEVYPRGQPNGYCSVLSCVQADITSVRLSEGPRWCTQSHTAALCLPQVVHGCTPAPVLLGWSACLLVLSCVCTMQASQCLEGADKRDLKVRLCINVLESPACLRL